MLQFIKRNREVSLVIVSTFDRFSRTGGNAIAITDQLAECGIAVQAAKEEIDASTTSGKALRSMKMIFSLMDNEARKEKSIDGTKTLLLKGGWAKRPPIGYTKKTKVNGVQKATINTTGKLIQKAFHMKIYERKTNTEIQSWLASVGIKMYRQRLTKLFKNPFYCGIVDDKTLDQPVQGIQEPMITQEEYLTLNGITKEFLKSSHKIDDNNFPLKTTVLCEKCGKPFTAYHVKKKNAKYYKCNYKGCKVNVNSQHLNSKFISLLQDHEINNNLVNLLKKQLTITFAYLTKTQRERFIQL